MRYLNLICQHLTALLWLKNILTVSMYLSNLEIYCTIFHLNEALDSMKHLHKHQKIMLCLYKCMAFLNLQSILLFSFPNVAVVKLPFSLLCRCPLQPASEA